MQHIIFLNCYDSSDKTKQICRITRAFSARINGTKTHLSQHMRFWFSDKGLSETANVQLRQRLRCSHDTLFAIWASTLEICVYRTFLYCDDYRHSLYDWHLFGKLYDPWVCTIITMWVRPSPVSEKVHNSLTTRYIFITFCTHMHANITWPLACEVPGIWQMWVCYSAIDPLVKILITLEPYGIFWMHTYIFVQPPCYAKRWRGFAEHHFGQSSSFSENAHNSGTA